ncbi:MAG: hypothetical protein ACSHX0_07920 [Akkermansiaceae bacterium]
MNHFFTIPLLSLGASIMTLTPLRAQTTQFDTVIEGDLEVQVDANGEKGDLSVDSSTELSKAPYVWTNSMAAHNLSVAEHYGPVRIGPRLHVVNMKFKKQATSTEDYFLDIPLGYWGYLSAASVTATIQVNESTYEMAQWELAGSRHRTIKALRHQAYGDGKYLSLKGTMHHGSMHLYLDCHKPTGVNANYTIHVEIEAMSEERWGSSNEVFKPDNLLSNVNLNNGNSFEPIEIIESTVYEKKETFELQLGLLDKAIKTWNGTLLNLNGDVVVEGDMTLAAPQGDISMGIFGE